ncbi:DUF3397 domain-containing protein [Saccharibacillus alkalitolerans]|uniref:DUF3397 domain-containing protein n=1 Tax=Saccharibacillus alkalitolerans TaxID=2705290 RepID=A0ABX0EYQ0_9BACL|nr:DUF3397 domain-containing protein [Saccharibacillus alkalitolerans]NGZ73866.1 DUF3397 domain-containing protein [Saccharibacillus alkalitolerans]
MFETVSGVLITLCVLPFLPFLLIYAVGALRREPKGLSFRRAMDFTTPFLVFSVSALYNYVFGSSFGFYLLLLALLILAGLLGSAQNRKRGRIDPVRLFKGFWRISFLLLAPCYLLLGISGFILHIVNS